MGNSEVGHLNLGAGAVVKQDLTRIDEAVERRHARRERRPARRGRGRAARAPHRPRLRRRRALGLEPPRGAHRDGRRGGADDVVVHAFTDGRDTLPDSGAGFLEQVQRLVREGVRAPRARGLRRRALLGDGPRQALGAHPEGLRHARRTAAPSTTPTAASRRSRAAYERGETRRVHRAARRSATRRASAPATRSSPSTSAPTACARSRARWPSRASTRSTAAASPPIERYATLTEYEEGWPYPVAFPPAHPETTLPHVIAAAGGRQLHVAETEKYPHVTYFFGGGEETPEEGERRELVPCPRDVPTYDKKPRDERPRGRPTRSCRRGRRTTSASGSSTSPTPTWSATPASSRRR